MAERKLENLHEYQKLALALKADIRWIPDGMLTVITKRARDYVLEKPEERYLLPMGLEHDTVLASIQKVASKLGNHWDYIWSAGSSGTLTRGLQLAWPDKTFFAVSVGHSMTEREKGKAIVFKSPYAFDKPTKTLPPFPSAPTYDAKVWEFLIKWKQESGIKDKILFWNVGA